MAWGVIARSHKGVYGFIYAITRLMQRIASKFDTPAECPKNISISQKRLDKPAERGSVFPMSRKKQSERYKILYTPRIKRMGMLFIDPALHLYAYNVAEVIGPPINDYVTLAGFDNEAEAKAYRRKKVQEEQK